MHAAPVLTPLPLCAVDLLQRTPRQEKKENEIFPRWAYCIKDEQISNVLQSINDEVSFEGLPPYDKMQPQNPHTYIWNLFMKNFQTLVGYRFRP